MPLLYIEFATDGVQAGKGVHRKRAIAAALKAALGTIVRKQDIAAAGPGGDWFVALLVARARRRRSQIIDADLGVAAERLRRTALAALLAGANGEARVRAGWSVVELGEGPTEPALRQAVRGAAVLARVEERRATILALVTHELRTPLAAIVGFAERLKDGPLRGAQRRRALEIIIEESNRLARLALGLIDMGAWSAGHLRLLSAPCALDELAARAAESVRTVAAGRNVTIRVGGRAHAMADPDRVAQVLVNLLDNAVRHAPPCSRVAVALSETRTASTAVVTNRGPAFPARVRRHLGRPFTRGAGGNVGLGLAISQIIVEAHGGRLSLERHGARNCVRIVLPRGPASRKESRRTEQVFVSNN